MRSAIKFCNILVDIPVNLLGCRTLDFSNLSEIITNLVFSWNSFCFKMSAENETNNLSNINKMYFFF